MLQPEATVGNAIPGTKRALVVDDEHAVRLVLKRWLQRRGWEVDEAEDGREAQAMLSPTDVGRSRSYELVICDLRMPKLNGPDLHCWMRAHRPDLLAHLVFSSGDVTEEEVARFLAANECRVLEKPFELTDLAQVVAQVSVSVAA